MPSRRFVRNASRYIDDGVGFATGWNFWLSQQALVIFEVVSFGLFLGFWESGRDVNQAITITLMIVAYLLLNVWTAKVRFISNLTPERLIDV